MSRPLLLFFLSSLLLPFTSLSLIQDGLHLLQAKSSLSNPSTALSSWNAVDPTPCNWSFVTCSSYSSSSVIALDLSNLNLIDPFPPSLYHLPDLTFLFLSNNYINSTLPSSSLLPCTSLLHLDLSQNLLVSPLPTSVPSLSSLLHLDLSDNNFPLPSPSSPVSGTFPSSTTSSPSPSPPFSPTSPYSANSISPMTHSPLAPSLPPSTLSSSQGLDVVNGVW